MFLLHLFSPLLHLLSFLPHHPLSLRLSSSTPPHILLLYVFDSKFTLSLCTHLPAPLYLLTVELVVFPAGSPPELSPCWYHSPRYRGDRRGQSVTFTLLQLSYTHPFNYVSVHTLTCSHPFIILFLYLQSDQSDLIHAKSCCVSLLSVLFFSRSIHCNYHEEMTVLLP